MALNLRFLPEIPQGYRILAGDEEVAGISYRIGAARAFAKGRKQSLLVEHEPRNRHDPNALKVIGVYKGWFFMHRVHLGYVSAETARLVADRQLRGKIQARLRNIWWGGYVRDFIVVRYDLLAQKDHATEREPHRAVASASRHALAGHYTQYVEEVKQLKSAGQLDNAIELLLRLVLMVESEARSQGVGVAPWYYEQLAILYRKQGRYEEEVHILERFEKQPKAPGTGPTKLADRLVKARLRLKKPEKNR